MPPKPATDTASRHFAISPRGPFSWEQSTLVLSHWAPVRRFAAGADGAVRLAFLLDGDHTPVAATLRWQDGRLHGELVGTNRVDAAAAQVARMFSLDHDASDYESVLARDPALAQLAAAHVGLRPVLFPSPYEAAVWAILSQRIRMDQALRLEERLIDVAGRCLRVGHEEIACVPAPARLLALGPSELPGLPLEKHERLRSVARAALAGELDVGTLRALGDQGAPTALRRIRGIGDFWSQGIYVRACGVRDVFPEEPRARAALGRLHGLGDEPSAAAVARLTDMYRPYRMWVCFLLRQSAR